MNILPVVATTNKSLQPTRILPRAAEAQRYADGEMISYESRLDSPKKRNSPNLLQRDLGSIESILQ